MLKLFSDLRLKHLLRLPTEPIRDETKYNRDGNVNPVPF